MNQPSDDTVRYYDENVRDYVRSTVSLPMEPLYQPFLDLLPAGGTILDAGCGSGRDTRAFQELGYEVLAIDASPKMVEAATQLTGKPAHQLRFQEMEFANQFDGVYGDAQRLEQLGWMFFLKIFDDREKEIELLRDKYKSPLPKDLRWSNWATDEEGITGDALLDFVNNTLLPKLKALTGGADKIAGLNPPAATPFQLRPECLRPDSPPSSRHVSRRP